MTETDQPKTGEGEAPEQPPMEEKEEVKGKTGLLASYYGLLHRMRPKPAKKTVSSTEARTDMSQIVVVPKISEPNIDEVEIISVKKNYSFVRIRYDNIANEYTYEVIEPKLTPDESDVLELLKETLVASVERMVEEDSEGKEKYLRRIT
jgi:hypothetical protein